GADRIHPAVPADDLRDQPRHVRLARDIDGHSGAADLLGDLRGAAGVHVGDDDRFRAFGGEPPAQRAADAVRAAGDDDNLVCDDHTRRLKNATTKARRVFVGLRVVVVNSPWRKSGVAPRRARRPDGKARRPRIPGVWAIPLTEVTPISSVSGAWTIIRGPWPSSRPGLRPRTHAGSI